MELYTDTQNCEAVNGALSPCIFCFVLSCLLMNLLMNFLMNLLLNLSPNSFQIVIYEYFCMFYGGLHACLFLSLFTCLSIFILLSRHTC